MVKTLDRQSTQQRAERGKAARAVLPREQLAEWNPGQRSLEPLDLLAEQAQTRIPELVPIRHARMAASPFAYYRGAALPMAADLATSTRSGIMVQLCGDAHLANFGGFASPERELLFDVNDFDETLPGPFEWDVKRLAASLEVAARGHAFDGRTAGTITLAGMRAYQQAIRDFAGMSNLDVWYARLDVDGVIQRWGGTVRAKRVKEFQRTVAKASSKDQIKARAKLTRADAGGLHFVSDPPLLVPVAELYGAVDAEAIEESIHETIRSYRRSLQGDRRRLLESYRFVDLARKVVGVGSVGTRAWVALFVGARDADTLILQVKEAEASVLERFVSRSAYNNQGQRVVEGQRLMQAASDIFLGWQTRHPGHRRATPRLLRPATVGLEAVGRHRHNAARRPGYLRSAVRVDSGPSSCSLRRPYRHQLVHGAQRPLPPSLVPFRHSLCRSKRHRSPKPRQSDRQRHRRRRRKYVVRSRTLGHPVPRFLCRDPLSRRLMVAAGWVGVRVSASGASIVS